MREKDPECRMHESAYVGTNRIALSLPHHASPRPPEGQALIEASVIALELGQITEMDIQQF